MSNPLYETTYKVRVTRADGYQYDMHVLGENPDAALSKISKSFSGKPDLTYEVVGTWDLRSGV